jgi:hypothetical protein
LIDTVVHAPSSARAATFRELGQSGELERRRLRLSSDAERLAAPVLGNLEFERGFIIRTPARPEGVPISEPAARLLALLDGARTVGEALAAFAGGLEPEAARRTGAAAVTMLQTLYSDGVFAPLEPAEAAP